MQPDELTPILAASLHDVRNFVALLRGVNFSNCATMTITETGLTVTAEEARTLVATAWVFKEIFDEYEYHPEVPADIPPSMNTVASQNEQTETVALEIPLNTLIECLNIFGTAGGPALSGLSKFKQWRRADDASAFGDEDDDQSNRNRRGRDPAGTGRIEQYFSGNEKRTGMRMSYAGPGHPLTLIVAEDAAGPTTTCEITTFDPEPHLDLPFDSDRMVLKIILKSSWLHEALSELDSSFDTLTFIGNPPLQPVSMGRNPALRPMLRIQARGTFGTTQMDYPNDREVLETFECTQSVSFSYRFGHIARTLRALQSSTKTSLRIDDEGLLSLQFMMPSPKPRGGLSTAFIDYRCLPLDESV